MFLERSSDKNKISENNQRRGWIEVICGCMFSGKTEELIRRLKRARIAKQKVEIFKPQVDARYDEKNIVSHDRNQIVSRAVASAAEILALAGDIEVVGVDEAQFFDAGLLAVCNELADRGIRVIVAGLDLDFRGEPFGPVPQLLAAAEYVTKVHAICMRCGELAHISHRTVADDQLIVIGEKDHYEPLCRKCFNEKKEI
jgi:thymidine kinase